MRFNSPVYWLFLAIVAVLLWAMPSRLRKGWLLLTSYLFYASWHWPYLVLLIGCGILTYLAVIWIDKADGAMRKRRGWAAVGLNLCVLFSFKYLDWAIANFNGVAEFSGVSARFPITGWILPLGISFYLFESASYIFDVVKKKEKPHSFWDVQLFIAFFPKLIAGPIMRAKEFLPQVKSLVPPSPPVVVAAFQDLALGLFTKLVLADGLSNNLDQGFSRGVGVLGTLDVWVLSLGFALQMYFDFSSYTRMAIGSGQLLGVKLVQNFNYPLSAESPVDFWNRWHISLSRWIRDYVYYPLVGGKLTLTNMCKAAVISMTLCGIWHGAGWKFLAWGFYHGALIAGYQLFRFATQSAKPKPPLKGWPATLKGAVSCLLLTAFLLPSWILFRAADLTNALQMIQKGLTFWHISARALPGRFYIHVAALLLLVWCAPVVNGYLAKVAGRWAARTSQPSRYAYAVVMGGFVGLLVAVCLVCLQNKTSFIYFQF